MVLRADGRHDRGRRHGRRRHIFITNDRYTPRVTNTRADRAARYSGADEHTLETLVEVGASIGGRRDDWLRNHDRAVGDGGVWAVS